MLRRFPILSRVRRRPHSGADPFRLLVEHMSDVVMRLGPDMIRTYVSPASLHVLGYTPDELLGGHPRGIIHPEDWARIPLLLEAARQADGPVRETYRVRHRDGHMVWVEGNYGSLDDGGFVVLLRDISERKAMEQRLQEANVELERLASRDALTGLANRGRFDKRLILEARRASRSARPLSVLLLDIDCFKLFNDRYGHQAGDDCLRAVASEMARTVNRPGDLAARYGGEEFVILLPETDETGAVLIAERLRERIRSLSLPHQDNQRRGGIVTASFGCASTCIEPASTLSSVTEITQDLLRRADRALYEAKRQGRNRVVCWSGFPTAPTPPLPTNEIERLEAVAKCRRGCADLPVDRLDHLAEIAANMLDMPIGFISLVDRDEMMVAGRHNMAADPIPRETSFCAHTIVGEDALMIEDARSDRRFRDNPLVTEGGMQFYAGMPLLLPGSDLKVGALCVMDVQVRPQLDARQRSILASIADLAVGLMVDPHQAPLDGREAVHQGISG